MWSLWSVQSSAIGFAVPHIEGTEAILLIERSERSGEFQEFQFRLLSQKWRLDMKTGYDLQVERLSHGDRNKQKTSEGTSRRYLKRSRIVCFVFAVKDKSGHPVGVLLGGRTAIWIELHPQWHLSGFRLWGTCSRQLFCLKPATPKALSLGFNLADEVWAF